MIAKVHSIYTSPEAVTLPTSKESVNAIEGVGLEGDRYAKKAGTFSHWLGNGRHVTLIELEALEEVNKLIPITAAEARRNIVTEGISLNDLVGKYFKVGEVLMYGARLCEPCAELEKRTRKGVLKALVKRGGLRADILSSGTISVGDTITVTD